MKNAAAVQLGRQGGRARMEKLSDEERGALASVAGTARWAKERAQRPPVHQVVRMMLEKIVETGRPHTLYLEKGFARFCESGSSYDRLWMQQPGNCVGTYSVGADFTQILTDVLAT